MTIIKKAILLAIAAILLSACIKKNTGYPPKISKITRPPIGSENTAKAGETILTRGNYHETKYLTFPNKVSVKWAYTLLPGKYNLISEDDVSGYYVPAKGVDEGGKIIKSSVADSWQSIQIFKNSPKLCVVTTSDNKFCKFDVNYNQVTVPEFGKNGFKQILVYNGKHENIISIGYLTFYNDNEQTRFNNTIDYDLDKSDIIEYRGAKIKVIEATQQYLKYSVINEFKKK
ncbi:MAG: hypothetical protein HQL71_02865 [Magnetococcales bacterium]|nr:hypothetical protein [Magnetococcales bacterium]